MGMPFPEPYMTLYNSSVSAVKSVDDRLRVGGPASSNLGNVQEFAAAASAAQIPFDFVSTHHYPTDSCKPSGSTWDPDCWANGVKASRESVASKPFYITEFNVGCCLGYAEHDMANAAAFAFRAIGTLDGVIDLLSWWTFTDVFEEGGFPTTEFSNIYGLMTVSGIPKPGWRGFQLLNGAGDRRVATSVSEPNVSIPIVAAFSTVSGSQSDLRVFLSTWSVPEAQNRSVTLEVQLPTGLQRSQFESAKLWRIDEDHANPLGAWKRMGSPARPSDSQLQTLLAASEISATPVEVRTTGETTVRLDVQMSPNAALVIDFGSSTSLAV